MCKQSIRRAAPLLCLAAVALAMGLVSNSVRADVTAEGDVTPIAPGIPIDGGVVAGDIIVGGTGVSTTTTVGILTIDVPAFTDPLAAVNLFIGNNADGVGQTTVSGLFSELQLDNNLVVGVAGQAWMDVTGGAVVTTDLLVEATATDPDAIIGQLEGAQGYVTVSGFGSKWQHTVLRVGDEGYGELRVSNRGRLETLTEATIGNEVMIDGNDNAIGTGYVEITGQGSRWNVAETLTVGEEGRGELQVRAGALVRVVEEIFLSDEANNNNVNSRGVAVVTDQNTELWTLEKLYVGGFGAGKDRAQGELYIRDGGRVRADLGLEVSSENDIVEMSGEIYRSTILAPTLVNHGVIRGSGRLEVNAITNDGYIRNATYGLNLREKLWVTGTVDNIDNIESHGGEMEFQSLVTNQAANGDILGVDAIFYFNGGLTNDGNLILDNTVVWSPSPVAVVNNGTLSLWGSNKSTIMGDLDLNGGGLVEMTIGDDFSQLEIAGDATLAGDISFTLADDYNPQAGDSFEIITAGSLSGAFSGFTMSPDPGLLWSLDYVGSSVFLEFGGVAPPISADFNDDGIVDALDLDLIRMNFGMEPATMADGDANNDGRVDGADFLIWQRQLGTSPVLPAALPIAAAVPEPTGMALAALGLLALVRGYSPRRTA